MSRNKTKPLLNNNNLIADDIRGGLSNMWCLAYLSMTTPTANFHSNQHQLCKKIQAAMAKPFIEPQAKKPDTQGVKRDVKKLSSVTFSMSISLVGNWHIYQITPKQSSESMPMLEEKIN